jgi:hypothetical protein
MERIMESTAPLCAGKEAANQNTPEGVYEPKPRDFILHYKPKMRPTLRRRNGEITLLIMDETGHLKCLVLCERDMNELVLSSAIINQEVAKERINARKQD